MTLLRDLRAVFSDQEKLPTEAILTALHNIEESPWEDLRGKPIDALWLSRHLKKNGVAAKDIRYDGKVVRGYDAADLADPWSRYVADPEEAIRKPGDPTNTPKEDGVGTAAKESATSDTSATATEEPAGNLDLHLPRLRRAPRGPTRRGMRMPRHARAGRLMVTLDWSHASHWSPRRLRCVHCGAPTNLRTATGKPAHKVCVERVINQQQKGRHLHVVKEAS